MIRRPLWLASRSPRRRQLLEEHGVPVRVEPADFDDASLQPGTVPPEQWVEALAYLKARRVADLLHERHPGHAIEGTVLGADTLCVHGTTLLGQPRSIDEARAMLLAMRDNTHRTMTGVAIIDLSTMDRRIFVDVTHVHVGQVTDRMIERYLSSNTWRGKAGGYNLAERLADGWPITCEGDPTTVMGLPMQRLLPLLKPTEEILP